MTRITSQKYGFWPDFVEEKTLNNENFCEIYDFHRLVKVQKLDERFRRKLRSPLEIGEKVLVLVEKLKKKDASGTLYKITTENMLLF